MPELIRFSLYTASQEWGISRETLRKKLITAGFDGEPDGYTVAEIDIAIHGDLAGERLRKAREDADEVAYRNAKERKELVEIEDFSRRLEAKATTARQLFMDAGLPSDKQDAILNGLADLFTKNV